MNKSLKLIKKPLKSFLHFLADVNEDIINLCFNPYEKGLYIEGYFVSKREMYNTIGNLKRYGYLSTKQEKGKILYFLTEKGKQEIAKAKVQKKIKHIKWDKKWRIVMCDIPENRRKVRDQLRITLLNLGFKRLQKSVWITPYDIFNELEMLVPNIKKHGWIRCIIAEKIFNEEKLTKEFKL